MEISVIIPVYNKKPYLQGLMNSLQAQTFRDFECLIVDDGSSDGSAEFCDEMERLDNRIHVFHIPNGGVSHARNVGLDAAKGKYITFIDSDDELDANYLMHLYDGITGNHVDMVIGGLETFGGSKKQTSIVHPLAPGRKKMNQLFVNFAKIQQDTGIYGYCVAKIFPRELLGEIRFDPKLKLAEDFDFYLRLYRKVQSVFLDAHTDYHYRQEADFSWMLLQDDQIDYVAQLHINLRYREFLKEQQAYTGQNREIVEKKINNYLYFSLFHCPQELLEERFRQLYQICAEHHVTPQGSGGMQKLCLDFLRNNQLPGVRMVLGAYRYARNIRNSLRKK